MGEPWASCLCERPPVSRVPSRGRNRGPPLQLWSQTAAKEALFFDPDCNRPPVYSCYLWSNCPGLNLNSFSIIARFCFLKINHWEYLSLGRERDQPSMKVVSRVSHSWVKGSERSGRVPKEGPLSQSPFVLLLPPIGVWGDTFLWIQAPLCSQTLHRYSGYPDHMGSGRDQSI